MIEDAAGDPMVTLSALEHWAYCPRQAALIWIDRTFADDERTTAGTLAHRRVNTEGTDHRPEAVVHRSVPLWSHRLGLHGYADTVEIVEDVIYPVEHKVGNPPPGGPADLQVTAQSLCLAEMMGKPVTVGYIFSDETRKRRPVDVSALTPTVEAEVRALRSALGRTRLPNPVNDDRCRTCSLKGVCLPDVVAAPSRLQAAWRHLFSREDGP
jgi:CRISPR-associated exonuclease Cas4